MTMNCNQAEMIWDEYRDQTLEQDQRAAFEAHLRECAVCGSAWAAESQWLIDLSDADAGRSTPADPVFTDAVLATWDRDLRQRYMLRFARVAGLAAAAMLVIGLTLHLNRTSDPVTPAPESALVADDPVGDLVVGLCSEVFVEQPQRISNLIEKTTQVLNWKSMASVLPLPTDPVTPPADVEEKRSRGGALPDRRIES